MKIRKQAPLLMAALVALSLGTAGCASDDYVSSKPAPRKVTTAAPTAKAAAQPTTQVDGDMRWTTMAFPTGNAATSAVSVRKGVPTEVMLNQPFEYLLSVTNISDLSLENVSVSDKLDANFKMSGSDPSGKASTGGVYDWTLGTIAAGETKTIRVMGAAIKEGTITSCATVSYNSSLCAAIPVVQPMLAITKAGPAEVLKCEDIVYTFTVKNAGTGALKDVRISDALPAGLATKDGKSTIDVNVGTLEPGKTQTYKATVRASRTGSFANKADATGANGIKAASNSVTTVVRAPVLTITKKGPAKQFLGRETKYDIVVKNTGDGVARDAIVRDTMPAGSSFVRASDGGKQAGSVVTWGLGDMAPGASKQVSVTLTGKQAGVHVNKATAQAFCADAVSASASTTYAGIPAILLEVLDVEDPIVIGGQETYVITVTNQGTAPATGISIKAKLDQATMTYVSSSGSTRGSYSGNIVTFAPLASLAPKAVATFKVVVRADKAGDVRFGVALNSDQLSTPVDETEATTFYE